MEQLNAAALEALVKQHHVKLTAFPGDLVTAARKQATDVLGELASRSAITGKVHASYMDFRAGTAPGRACRARWCCGRGGVSLPDARAFVRSRTAEGSIHAGRWLAAVRIQIGVDRSTA